LNLDTKFGANANAQTVRALLLEREVSIGVISFLTKEMEGACTLSLIMDRMRRFQASQRLPSIASLLPKDVTSLDSLPAELKCMIDAVSSTLKKPTERVFQSLLKYQAGRDKVSLRHQLARRYNNAEGLALEDGLGVAASLENDDDFKTYCRITDLDPANAMQKVKDTAMSYNDTFWRNFEKLKIYRETYQDDVMTVEGKCILTVDDNRETRRKYTDLNRWMLVMNGYAKEFNKGENKYGFIAYQQMGSLEQIALAELDVCFDPDTMKTAMDNRTGDRIVGTQIKMAPWKIS